MYLFHFFSVPQRASDEPIDIAAATRPTTRFRTRPTKRKSSSITGARA